MEQSAVAAREPSSSQEREVPPGYHPFRWHEIHGATAMVAQPFSIGSRARTPASGAPPARQSTAENYNTSSVCSTGCASHRGILLLSYGKYDSPLFDLGYGILDLSWQGVIVVASACSSVRLGVRLLHVVAIDRCSALLVVVVVTTLWCGDNCNGMHVNANAMVTTPWPCPCPWPW
jgi:hypothetical protein